MPRLRVVLKDVLYRSGTPTEDGLEQMCKNGWKRVYSLYGDRTSAHGPRNQAMTARGYDERRCKAEAGARVLEWRSAPSSRQRSMPRILQDVVDAVRDGRQGPVLVHCWNGLHYAGMVSAMVLRQFCGLSGEEAEAYWWATTSGGQNYPNIVRHIREFQPLPGYSLTAAERDRVCPPQKKSITLAGVWKTTLTTVPSRQSAVVGAASPGSSAGTADRQTASGASH